MPSPELERFLAGFPESMVDAADPLELVVSKMMAIHPRGYRETSTVEHLELAGVPCAWVSTPATEPGRDVFFVHGGAFVSTGLDQYYGYAENVADHCGARVLVFEYGLAPAFLFPGQLEQTVAVWRAAGMDPARTVFMGDSCGGGIALAALCRLRDDGDALPAAWVGLTPWLDALQEGDAACHPRGVDPFVNAAWIRARFRDVAGDHPLGDPFLSPIHAELRGLPPLFLGAGSIDTTCDDATRLAARAAAAGVQVQLDLVASGIHGMHGLAGMCPESTAAMQRVGEFVRRYLP